MRPDRTATLLCDSLLARTGLLDAAAATPVLMYHSVSSDDEPGVSPYYRLATSPQRFRDQMCLLADSGWVVTSLEQAAAPRRETARDRQVVVTFDDGFVDFLTAWPILEKLSFTASMFLPTGYIAETRRTFKGRECLTWSEVKDLSRRGVSFGSHTVTHPVLHRVPWSRVCSELRLSRAHITTAVGTPVTTFAYPYAFPAHDDAFVARFCRELRDQGYRAAVTTTIGRVGPGDDPLRLKRLPVNEGDDPALFRAKLRGAYDWLGVLQSASKRVRARRYSDEERLAYASATIGRP
jgi:peptidoglycan/xylan/chitin deacetylase (PgdA/CDA1 family)